MESVAVKTPKKAYPVYIDGDFTGLRAAFENAGFCNRRLIIVSDDNVASLYSGVVKAALAALTDKISLVIFEHGEENKNLDTMHQIYNGLVDSGADRNCAVIALGGGVTGDMAGFAAATYMRGIRYVQIPTSLIAQTDSAVGGKVGVDFGGAKNLVGAFYQPELVYINYATLQTLPTEAFISGMGEVIKYGVIHDGDFLNYLRDHVDLIKQLDPAALSYIIKKSVEIKAEIVAADERDRGIRRILNFGHTFGHAVESVSGFEIAHGKCVALGMVCATALSCKLNQLHIGKYYQVRDLLSAYGLPLTVGSPMDKQAIFNAMRMDKKSVDGRICPVLLTDFGKAYCAVSVADDDILEVTQKILDN